MPFSLSQLKPFAAFFYVRFSICPHHGYLSSQHLLRGCAPALRKFRAGGLQFFAKNRPATAYNLFTQACSIMHVTQMTSKDTFFLLVSPSCRERTPQGRGVWPSRSRLLREYPSHFHTLKPFAAFFYFLSSFFYCDPIAHHGYMLSHHNFADFACSLVQAPCSPLHICNPPTRNNLQLYFDLLQPFTRNTNNIK